MSTSVSSSKLQTKSRSKKLAAPGVRTHVWKPLPGPQTMLFESTAFEIGYGGSAGGGKSLGALFKALIRMRTPGINAVLFRRTFPELDGADGLIAQSRKWFPLAGGKYSETRHVWKFPNMATTRFGHMAHENDYLNHSGAQYQFIAFDELQHFMDIQYRFLFSRARGLTDEDMWTQIVSTFNPPDEQEPGFGWIMRRWGPWIDKAHPHPAKSGEIRYFVADGDEEREVPKGTPGSWSRTFIRAGIDDNPMLGDEYKRNLDLLPWGMRQRLKHGDFYATSGKGKVFNRAWFKRVKAFPSAANLQFFRGWDFAATEKKIGIKGDPDYTATVLLTIHEGAVYFMADKDRRSWSNVERWVKERADPEPGVTVVLEQEPGSSGKATTERLVTLLHGRKVRKVRPMGSKVERALPLSAQAEVGNVYIVENPNLSTDDIVAEFHALPEGAHEDIVDAASIAYNTAVDKRSVIIPAMNIPVMLKEDDDDE